MEYTIAFDTDKKIVRLTMHGPIVPAGLPTLVSELIATAKEHSCHRILNDARGATIDIATLGIYRLPQIFQDQGSRVGMDVRRFKRAMVVSTDLDDFGFYETVSLNQGQTVKLFSNTEEALEWLTRD